MSYTQKLYIVIFIKTYKSGSHTTKPLDITGFESEPPVNHQWFTKVVHNVKTLDISALCGCVDVNHFFGSVVH